MRIARTPVEPGRKAASPVLAIHVDIDPLIAAIRRHVPLTPKASRAIRADFARLFAATRIDVVSSSSARISRSTANQPTKSSSKGPP